MSKPTKNEPSEFHISESLCEGRSEQHFLDCLLKQQTKRKRLFFFISSSFVAISLFQSLSSRLPEPAAKSLFWNASNETRNKAASSVSLPSPLRSALGTHFMAAAGQTNVPTNVTVQTMAHFLAVVVDCAHSMQTMCRLLLGRDSLVGSLDYVVGHEPSCIGASEPD